MSALVMKFNPFSRIRLSSLSHGYLWPKDGKDDPKLQGEPDDSSFDITNGYEVLYMIDYIMQGMDTYSSQVVREIEALIHQYPLSLPTQMELRNFINVSWVASRRKI